MLTNAQMVAVINAHGSISYRGRILTSTYDLPSDEQIAIDAAADAAIRPGGTLSADDKTKLDLLTLSEDAESFVGLGGLSDENTAKLALLTVNGTTEPIGLVIGTPAFAYPVPDPGGAGVRLVVAGSVGDANNWPTTALIGCDNASYDMDGLQAYTGSGSALYGKAVSGVGVNGESTTSNGVIGTATAVDKAGVRGLGNGSAAGVWGRSANATGPGVDADGGANHLALRVRGGPSVWQEVVAPSGNPAAGYQYIYLDSTSHKLCRKDSSGTVVEIG